MEKIKRIISIIFVSIVILSLCGWDASDTTGKTSSKAYTLIDSIISMNNLQNWGCIAGDEEYLYFFVDNVNGFNRMDFFV